MFVTAVAGVLAEADADAGLRDVLARVLEANERWEQLAAELRAENAQLREENAVYRGRPVSPFGDRLRAPISRSGVAGSALSAMTQATGWPAATFRVRRAAADEAVTSWGALVDAVWAAVGEDPLNDVLGVPLPMLNDAVPGLDSQVAADALIGSAAYVGTLGELTSKPDLFGNAESRRPAAASVIQRGITR